MASIVLLKSLLLANNLQAATRKRKKIGTNVKLQGFRYDSVLHIHKKL